MYEVVWPSGRKAAGEGRLARRLETLEGKAIGELWDWLYRGDEIFAVIEKELAERYPGIRFVGYREFGRTLGTEAAVSLGSLPGKLGQSRCDAVISSMGC